MVTACIDFGNSRLKAAIFEKGLQINELDLSGGLMSSLQEMLTEFRPARSILASVIDHPSEAEKLLSNETDFHLVSHQSKLNFAIEVNKPETIGPDRLAIMAATVDAYPNQNNLVISLGSCITYNFIDHRNVFLGGAISPGLNMRFRAMKDYTAKLPALSAENVVHQFELPLIGYDTVTNMQSGVVYGMISEIDGIIERYRERYGNFNALLTGGNSPYFARQLKNRIFADSNFLFKGLYALSEINKGDR